jgi:drug/metabolite transporter (DMT)-like permease
VGNGALTFTELLIPSGMAGLIITTQPFWMVGFEALLPGGERLHAPTIGGMAIGLVGASFLFTPDVGAHGIDRNVLHGFLLLEVGLAGWSFGSIYQRRQTGQSAPGDRRRGAATGGRADAGAVRAGHPRAPGPLERARRGALLYLVCFGSIVGYSAYAYAMDRLPVAIVSVYPYVNAVVAVALGWLFYREPFGRREALAMAIIFAGVAIVKRYSRHPVAG